jgi:hypothetical protein
VAEPRLKPAEARSGVCAAVSLEGVGPRLCLVLGRLDASLRLVLVTRRWLGMCVWKKGCLGGWSGGRGGDSVDNCNSKILLMWWLLTCYSDVLRMRLNNVNELVDLGERTCEPSI